MEKSHTSHTQQINPTLVKKELQQQAKSEVENFIFKEREYAKRLPFEIISADKYIQISDKNLPKFGLKIDNTNQKVSMNEIKYIDIQLLKWIIALIFSNYHITDPAIKSAIVQQLFPYLPSNAYLFLLEFLKQYEKMHNINPIKGMNYIVVLEKAIEHLPIENGFYDKPILTLVRAELKIILGIEYIKLATENNIEFLETASNYINDGCQAINSSVVFEEGIEITALNLLNETIPHEIARRKGIANAEIVKRKVIAQIEELEKANAGADKFFRFSLSAEEKNSRTSLVKNAHGIKEYLKSSTLNSGEYKWLTEKAITGIFIEQKQTIYDLANSSSSSHFYPCLKKLIELLDSQDFKNYLELLNPEKTKENKKFSTLIEKILTIMEELQQNNAEEKKIRTESFFAQRWQVLAPKISEIPQWLENNVKQDWGLECSACGEFGGGSWELEVAGYFIQVTSATSGDNISQLKIRSADEKFKEIKFIEAEALKYIFIMILNENLPKKCRIALAKEIFSYLPVDTYFIYSKLLSMDIPKKYLKESGFTDADYLDILSQCIKSYYFNNHVYYANHEKEPFIRLVFSSLLQVIAEQYIEIANKNLSGKNLKSVLSFETMLKQCMFIVNAISSAENNNLLEFTDLNDFQITLLELLQTSIKLAIKVLSAWKPKTLATKHDSEEIKKRHAIIAAAKEIVKNNEFNKEKIEEFIAENEESYKGNNSLLGIGKSTAFQPQLKRLIEILKKYQNRYYYCESNFPKEVESMRGKQQEKEASHYDQSMGSKELESWLQKNSNSAEISCLKKQENLSHCWQLKVSGLDLNVYVNNNTYSISGLKSEFIEIEKLKFILLVFLDNGIEPQCKIDLAKALFAHLPTKTYITYFELLLESKIFSSIGEEAYLNILLVGIKQFPVDNGALDQKDREEQLPKFKNRIVEKYPLNHTCWSSAKDNALMLKNMSHMFDLYQELKIGIDDKFKQAMKKLFHACIRWIVNDLNNWTPALFSTTFNKSDKTERRRVVKESVINLISGDEISRDTLINCLVLITDEIEKDKESKIVGKSEKFVPQLRELRKILTKYFEYVLKEGPDDSLEKAMLSARRKMDEMRVQKDVVDGENGDEELKDMAKTPG